MAFKFVDQPTVIHVLDITGRIVKKFKIEGNTSVSLKDLSSGVYVINEVNSNHKIKIVKY